MNEPNTLTEEFERLLQDKPAQIDFLAVFSDSMGSENWALLFGADKHTMKSKYHNGGTGIPIKFIDWLDPLFEETHYLAKEYIDDNVLDDEPDWPGAYLAARIVFIAAAHDAEIGQEIYRNLLADEPEGDDPSEVHNKSRAEKHFEYPLHLVDHRDLEEAFCQMIGIEKNNRDRGRYR